MATRSPEPRHPTIARRTSARDNAARPAIRFAPNDDTGPKVQWLGRSVRSNLSGMTLRVSMPGGDDATGA